MAVDPALLRDPLPSAFVLGPLSLRQSPSLAYLGTPPPSPLSPPQLLASGMAPGFGGGSTGYYFRRLSPPPVRPEGSTPRLQGRKLSGTSPTFGTSKSLQVSSPPSGEPGGPPPQQQLIELLGRVQAENERLLRENEELKELSARPSDPDNTSQPTSLGYPSLPSAASPLSGSHGAPLGYDAWQSLGDLFASLERCWEAWGRQPITLPDLLSSKNSHSLLPITLDPAPLCDGCSERPAEFACPEDLLRFECPQRHFACERCFEMGFNCHRGILHGQEREYTVIVMKHAFQEADEDQSGALDFLQTITFLALASQRLPVFPPSSAGVMERLHNLFADYAVDEPGLGVVAIRQLCKDAFRISPRNLSRHFEAHVPAGQVARFPQFLWILHSLARPDCPYSQRWAAADKAVRGSQRATISYHAQPATCPGTVPDFIKSKCRILQLLGEGSFSVVWLVEYDGVRMAAKVPKPSLGEQDREALFAATRTQALIDHPNVLRVLGVHQDCAWPCVLLELAEGGDLTVWQSGDVDPSLQWKAAMDVAQGLAALHAHDPPILHRDVKGDNVFFTKDGTAKLADFDFVVRTDPASRTARGICGSPGFIAPEVLRDEAYSAKADVFSYGSLLYEMTHKAFPFAEHLQGDASLSATRWAEVMKDRTLRGEFPSLNANAASPRMLQLIRECWDPDPERRPSMAAVCERLTAVWVEVMTHHGPTRAPSTPPPDDLD